MGGKRDTTADAVPTQREAQDLHVAPRPFSPVTMRKHAQIRPVAILGRKRGDGSLRAYVHLKRIILNRKGQLKQKRLRSPEWAW